MDPTPAALQIFFTGLSTQYQAGYEMPAPWAKQIAMTVPSDTELETYAWADRVDKMREWVGPRVIHSGALRSRSIVNKDWEYTRSIPRNRFLDDKLGLYSNIAQDMGWQAAKLHDQQLALLIQSNPTGFDGKAFFATDHYINIDAASGSQSNLLSLSLTPDNYASARKTFRSWVGHDGQPMGSRPSLLVVPPSLEHAARIILNSDMIAPGTFGGATQVGANTNILKGSAELLVIDELENEPTTWYLLDNSSLVKPFVIQERQAPQFTYLNNPTDPNVFFKKEYIFGVDSRSAYDVSLWFKALQSTP